MVFSFIFSKRLIVLIFLLINSYFISNCFAMFTETEITEHKNCTGAKTKSISSYKKEGKQYIRKKFKEKEDLKSELTNVLYLEDDIQKYLKTKKSEMPSIAKYYEHYSYYIDYEIAEGEMLREFLIKASLADFDYPDHKVNCLKAVKKVGWSIALFHLEYKDEDSKDTFFTSCHGDMHPSNIFMKLLDGSVTFIDYETLSFSQKKDVNIDIDKLFNHETRVIRSWTTQIAEKFKTRMKTHKREKSQEACVNDYLLFQNALMEGYNSALDAANVNFTLIKEDKTIKLIPKLK